MAPIDTVVLVLAVTFSSMQAAMLEPKQPCVPTSVVKGPCHDCICTEKGIYHCNSVECKELGERRFTYECKPYQIYRDKHIICRCSESGQWSSKLCLDTFRFVQPKSRYGEKRLRTQISCKPGSLYLAECNVCKCSSSGTIECSNRRCPIGKKTISCEYGDFLKIDNELCSCSDANVYIDRLCIKIGNKSVLKIESKDLAPIIHQNSWDNESCSPDEKYWLDCNPCTCDEKGDLQCTNNPCYKLPFSDNILRLQSKSTRTITNERFIPEVKEENASCVPGHSYSISCNSCVCSESGILHSNNKELPEIHEGEPCITGKMYRLDCNTCQCTKSDLVCTKMACLPKSVMLKATMRRALKEFPNATSSCVPGEFYKKGCRKCFCQANGKALCSHIENCKDIFVGPSSPAALRTFSNVEFNKLPSLPHQAAACEPGMTYRVDCNSCLCLANGNLACEKLLCPSFDDVNRLNAKSMSGGNCTKGQKLSAPCIKCTCSEENKYKCMSIPGCVTPESRKSLHGDYLEGARHHYDPKTQKCKEGMVYRSDCNKCYCQKDLTARCTQRTCLNHSQVDRMKKLRLKLERNGI